MEAIDLKVPGDVVRALRLPTEEAEKELRKELALALYARGSLSLGKASELAGVPLAEFDERVGHRHIRRHYGEQELS